VNKRLVNKQRQKAIDNLQPQRIEVARIEIIRDFTPNAFKQFISNPFIEFYDSQADGGNEGYDYCYLIGYRMETIPEFQKRKAGLIDFYQKQEIADKEMVKKNAKWRREQELITLAKLKKKYEK